MYLKKQYIITSGLISMSLLYLFMYKFFAWNKQQEHKTETCTSITLPTTHMQKLSSYKSSVLVTHLYSNSRPVFWELHSGCFRSLGAVYLAPKLYTEITQGQILIGISFTFIFSNVFFFSMDPHPSQQQTRNMCMCVCALKNFHVALFLPFYTAYTLQDTGADMTCMML